MKYSIYLIFLCFLSNLYSQEKESMSLYKKAIQSQIDFERADNPYSTMDILFKDRRYEEIDLSHEGVILNNLDQKELEEKSRKGIDIIEVYPIEVLGDRIEIEVLSIYKKKKKITIYGKSSYTFKYDCEKEEYVLIDKNQKMI